MAIIQEIDMTVLTRSLKLLHSPDVDSAEQLRAIVEDTLKSKYGNKKPISLIGLNKKTIINLEDTNRSNKRIKLDGSCTTSSLYSGTAEQYLTSDSDSDDGVALEILDDDLSCIVCREMAVGAGNNLVECLECHSLYHQECHNPPITQDVNDPRFVWYCASCTKTMNKVGASSGSKGSPSGSGHLAKPSKSSSKTSSNIKPFGTFSSSGKSSSSSSSTKNSSSGHSSNKTSTIPVPKINITVDKRLQIMKKNAAKKQEKRKLSK